MTPSRWPLVLLLLSVGLSCATLYIAVFPSAAGHRVADSTASAGSSVAELRRELTGVTQAMGRACRELELLGDQLKSMRVRPELDEENLNRLKLLLRTEVLAPLTTMLEKPALLPPVVAPAEPDLQRRSVIAEIAHLKEVTREKSHFLWTMEMVAARYGEPDNVTVTDGIVSWNYSWAEYFMSIGFSAGHAIRTHIQLRR